MAKHKRKFIGAAVLAVLLVAAWFASGGIPAREELPAQTAGEVQQPSAGAEQPPEPSESPEPEPVPVPLEVTAREQEPAAPQAQTTAPVRERSDAPAEPKEAEEVPAEAALTVTLSVRCDTI
ncbi:MAG: hypothetical protein LBH54_02315, partial [Clostridiales bacterium]|nr:hypothetical protein [Clostridiales bacterium]